MSRVLDSHIFNGLLDLPETVEKMIFSSHRPHEAGREGAKSSGNIPVDILEKPKEYVFLMDVPGISKSDIQVMVEDERTLVVKTNGKRKREETEEEEGCKYIRLERRSRSNKLLRKFRLPEDANTSGVTAKCENGVLMVTVEKLPPPEAKTKKVEVCIA